VVGAGRHRLQRRYEVAAARAAVVTVHRSRRVGGRGGRAQRSGALFRVRAGPLQLPPDVLHAQRLALSRDLFRRHGRPPADGVRQFPGHDVADVAEPPAGRGHGERRSAAKVDAAAAQFGVQAVRLQHRWKAELAPGQYGGRRRPADATAAAVVVVVVVCVCGVVVVEVGSRA